MALRALVERDHDGVIQRCLYTCPRTALRQFAEEFADNGYTCFILRHGKDVIPEGVDTVLVANSTMVTVHRDQLRKWRPELVVIDEAHAQKTAGAKRTQALYGNALDGRGGIIENVPYVLAMSGTFCPNHNGELYSHLHALAPNAILDERGRVMRRNQFEQQYRRVRGAPGAGRHGPRRHHRLEELG